jgi:GTP-binding protein
MASKQKPFAILLTKADKISKNKLSQAEKKVNDILSEMNIEVPVIPCSGDTGKGVQEIQSLITEFKDYNYTE